MMSATKSTISATSRAKTCLLTVSEVPQPEPDFAVGSHLVSIKSRMLSPSKQTKRTHQTVVERHGEWESTKIIKCAGFVCVEGR